MILLLFKFKMDILVLVAVGRGLVVGVDYEWSPVRVERLMEATHVTTGLIVRL